MKLAAYLLVICLALAAAAQDVNKPAQATKQVNSSAASSSRSASQDQLDPAVLDEKTTCYTIRAYMFTSPKTGAPKPVGSTTCVPSRQRALKRIDRTTPSELRLVY